MKADLDKETSEVFKGALPAGADLKAAPKI